MELLYIVDNAFFAHGNLFDDSAAKVARYRCCVIQLDRMDTTLLLFCMSAVMMDTQKKYKLALWILAVLPLLLYCCEFTSRKEYLKIFFEYLGYGIIILFTFAFIFYRVKFKKSGIMDATYIMDAICDALSLSVTIFVLKPLLFF